MPSDVVPGTGCQNYRIRISAGLMLFFHGNGTLSDCVGSLFANFRPNVLGLT